MNYSINNKTQLVLTDFLLNKLHFLDHTFGKTLLKKGKDVKTESDYE